MNDKIAMIRRFLVSDDGPTAVEYSMMLALIVAACITIVSQFGAARSSTFSTVNSVFGSSS